MSEHNDVTRPAHYTGLWVEGVPGPMRLECRSLIEALLREKLDHSFIRLPPESAYYYANAIKYLWRVGVKAVSDDPANDAVRDLYKAAECARWTARLLADKYDIDWVAMEDRMEGREPEKRATDSGQGEADNNTHPSCLDCANSASKTHGGWHCLKDRYRLFHDVATRCFYFTPAKEDTP